MRRQSHRPVSVRRSVGVAEHRKARLRMHAGQLRANVLRFVAVATIGALGLVPATSAHAASAGERVAATRQAIEQAAEHWFAAQNEAAAIDAQIADIEHRLADAQARVAAARKLATARAITLYKTNDMSFASVLGNDALDAARRAELANQANAISQDAINGLTSAIDDLKEQRRDLEAQRAQQREILREVASVRASLDAQLGQARAQARREAEAALGAARGNAARVRATARLAALRIPYVAAPVAAPTSPDPAPAISAPTPDPAPAAGGGVSPHHDDPFLVCTRARESNGIYTAVSPSGYYGAYQFLPSTWDTTAVHAGRGDLVGVLPSRASEYDQDEMAWVLYQWQGKGPWGGRC